MNKVLRRYIDGFTITNVISVDSGNLLKYHNQGETAKHSLKVAEGVVKLLDAYYYLMPISG